LGLLQGLHSRSAISHGSRCASCSHLSLPRGGSPSSLTIRRDPSGYNGVPDFPSKSPDFLYTVSPSLTPSQPTGQKQSKCGLTSVSLARQKPSRGPRLAPQIWGPRYGLSRCHASGISTNSGPPQVPLHGGPFALEGLAIRREFRVPY
jgi:hypothetical protein